VGFCVGCMFLGVNQVYFLFCGFFVWVFVSFRGLWLAMCGCLGLIVLFVILCEVFCWLCRFCWF